jgi:hypothetical protein
MPIRPGLPDCDAIIIIACAAIGFIMAAAPIGFMPPIPLIAAAAAIGFIAPIPIIMAAAGIMPMGPIMAIGRPAAGLMAPAGPACGPAEGPWPNRPPRAEKFDEVEDEALPAVKRNENFNGESKIGQRLNIRSLFDMSLPR